VEKCKSVKHQWKHNNISYKTEIEYSLGESMRVHGNRCGTGHHYTYRWYKPAGNHMIQVKISHSVIEKNREVDDVQYNGKMPYAPSQRKADLYKGGGYNYRSHGKSRNKTSQGMMF